MGERKSLGVSILDSSSSEEGRGQSTAVIGKSW